MRRLTANILSVTARIGLTWRMLLPALLAIVASVWAVQTWTIQAVTTYEQDRVGTELQRGMALLKQRLSSLGPVVEADGAGALFVGGKPLAERFDIVDEVTLGSGAVATIFAGDLRIATSIRSAEGKRAVGTRLAPGTAHSAVIGQGRSFAGENMILGVAHRTLYEPVRDAAGKQVGILFVGVPLATMAAQIEAVGDPAGDHVAQ